MKFKIITFVFIILLGCQLKKEEITAYDANFEQRLIPSIQVKSEPRFYKIEDRMEHYHVPGIEVVIVKNGKIVFNKGYGYARKDDSIKVSPQTIFQAGSIAKSITAATVIRLVEKGILDLDKNIANYLATWKFPENEYTKNTPITLRMLLSHTAGINNNNHKGFPQNTTLPTLNEMLNGYQQYKKTTLDTLPGVMYKYSNNGYGVIEKIIEDVTDKAFNEIVKEEVFYPLKMTQSTFLRKKYVENDTLVSFAYDKQGNLIPNYWNSAAIKASGGLWTSGEDLAKFLMAMQKSVTTNKGFIEQQQAKEMVTRVKANYGLGFDLKHKNDSLLFYHSGKNVGYTNLMMASYKGGNAVVILTNGDNGGYLFSEIVRGISKVEGWDFLTPKLIETVDVPESTLASYLGEYKLNFQGETYTFFVEKEGKYIKLFDPDEKETYTLRALSETDFLDINEGNSVKFVRNKNETITLLWDGHFKFEKIK